MIVVVGDSTLRSAIMFPGETPEITVTTRTTRTTTGEDKNNTTTNIKIIVTQIKIPKHFCSRCCINSKISLDCTLFIIIKETYMKCWKIFKEEATTTIGIERILSSLSTCLGNIVAFRKSVKSSRIKEILAMLILMEKCLAFNSKKCKMLRTLSTIPNSSCIRDWNLN